MDLAQKMELVKRNAEEMVTENEIEELVSRPFKFYYGIAPTGPVHLGYFISLGKLIDLMEIGGKPTILIADYHAYLDDMKTPWEEMETRADYYTTAIKLTLKDKAEKVKFMRGSEFQTKEAYIKDIFKASAMTTSKRALRAARETVRITEAPSVSALLYPIMQSLDIKALDAELAIGGIDQRNVYMFARELFPKLDLEIPSFIFMPLVHSLKGPGHKMSASIPGSHIKIHDSPEQIKKLIRSAYCPVGDIVDNPVIELAQYIIFPQFGEIEIKRPEKFGGDVVYTEIDALKSDFISKKLHPVDLKNAVTEYITKLCKPAYEYFSKHVEEIPM